MPGLRKLTLDEVERLCRACEGFMDALADYRAAYQSDDFRPFERLEDPSCRFTVHPHYSHDWGAAARINSAIMRLYAHGRTVLSLRLLTRGGWRQTETHREWRQNIGRGLRAVRWIVQEAEPSSTLAHRLHGKVKRDGIWAMPRTDEEAFVAAVDFVAWTHYAAVTPYRAGELTETQPPSQHPPGIHRNAMVLLKVLANAPGGQVMRRTDVAAASSERDGPKGEKSVGKWLAVLVKSGLADKPYGRQGGYAITDAGRDRLANVRRIPD